ncbi:MAG: hypothetical protein BWX88_03684 [Planctomycetes bacterium ADurb.Bin126]|nr:MAG: hypothetical protein BWX88_03684 [Planctomycetes bacterium ADurb.Bin126]HOD82756.1 DUF503 domain-containing protein [Phycisphaerae bacterium]HQL73391.1 DUF503 domain-containing protein [Phycisphaerae bacterium]
MATTLGLLHLEFRIAGASSLKDKRRSVKSFKDRLAARRNVSVAEVEAQDDHRRAVVAVAMVGSDRRYVEGALQQIVNEAVAYRDMVLVEHELEWL